MDMSKLGIRLALTVLVTNYVRWSTRKIKRGNLLCIYSSFNDAFNCSDHIASKER